MEISEKTITKFWNEFREIAAQIELSPNDKKMIAKLDGLVNELGDFAWEYGPSENKEWYFCISPQFNLKLKPSVEKIISFALPIENWEFFSAKPPKKWEGAWKMHNNDGSVLNIDSENWKVVVFQFPDGTYDLDVKLEGINCSENTKYSAVNILLVNVVGEDKYMRLIENVKIVDDFGENNDRAVLIKDLDKIIT